MTAPAYRDLPVVSGAPAGSAWGVFGEHDEVGTINWLTEEHVRRAASLVRRGAVFPLNWSLDLPKPAILGRESPRHRLIPLGGGYDDAYDAFYPQASSQWDSLMHVEHPQAGYYNGYREEALSVDGGAHLGIQHWARRGIAGRWVLADVGRHLARRGDPLDCGTRRSVSVDEVEDVLAAQDVTVAGGDILLLRFGWIHWYTGLDEQTRSRLGDGQLFAAPGLAAEERTAEWLWNHQVAVIAADCPALEAMPFDKSSAEGFLHARLIALLGMAIGELFDLERLAEDCARDRVYEGLFTAAPLNKTGGAGSTGNALALK